MDIKKFITIILILVFASPVFSAIMISSQDFETGDDWKSDFTGSVTWTDHVTTTTSNPHGGTKSLRWNQDRDRTDPITGLPGEGNPLLDYRGTPSFTGSTPNEMYFIFWFRHDDYTNTKTGVPKKLFFLVEDTYGTGAMVMGGQFGNTSLSLGYSNNAYSRAWAYDNWGTAVIYYNFTDTTKSLAGVWRKCEMYFNYDNNYCMLWVDGYLILPKTSGSNATYWSLYPADAAAGRIKWDPTLTLHYKGIQFLWYDRDRDLENEADGTGYYSGIQIDDIEVWDGMPSGGDTNPPTTSGHSPNRSETGVAKDTTIVVIVSDPGDGVDSLSIKVEGVTYTEADGEVVVTGTAASSTITYTNAGDFAYDQEVNVEVNASDGTNAMDPDIYSFTIMSEPVPPSEESKGVTYGNKNLLYGNKTVRVD